MQRSSNPFAVLADRAEIGDVFAQAELRRQLEPELVRIVRRVIQKGPGPSSMDRRILAEARRLGLDEGEAAPESLIQQVAHSVGSLVLDGLRAKQAGRAAAADTVCM
jgi:hypothetical protein